MKKGRFSKLIVALSVILILVYTVTAFALQFVCGVEVSPTLTTCFYTFWAVEMLSLAGIKTFKTKYDSGEYSVEDCTEDGSEVTENDC